MKIDPPSLAQRYNAVLPQVRSLAISWRLIASPGYQLASQLGPELSRGSLLMTDLGVVVMYGNPFTGLAWNTLLAVTTSESRSFMPLGITLSAGMNQFVEPTGPVVIDMKAALPKLVSINGNQLSVDGQMVSLSSRPVEITFTTDNPNATFYGLLITDYVANEAGTAVEKSQVLFAAAAEARFAVRPDLFKIGHSYVLRASCIYGGYPEIGAGDFVTRALPMTEAFLDSAVFTVVP
jgi:hypothetical protein